MKLILTGILLFFFNFSNAQDTCNYKPQVTVSDWTLVKNFKKSFSEDSTFEESEWSIQSGTNGMLYRSSQYPCGVYDTFVEIQYRIKPVNGLQQKRFRTTQWLPSTEKPAKVKTTYEIIIDSLSTK